MTTVDEQAQPFGPLDEISMVQEVARGFLARHWPNQHATTMSEQSEEISRLWRALAGQGWTRLGSDPNEGELPFALALMQELGRAACPAPLMDAFIANIALPTANTAGRDDSFNSLIVGMHEGTRRVSWVFGPANGDEGAWRLVRSQSAEKTRLDGIASFIENAVSATELIVVLDEASREVAIVATNCAGVRISETPGLSTPPLSEIYFDNVEPSHLLTLKADPKQLPSLARLLLAARAFGAVQRGFELLTAYANVRTQFGKRIGSFQAIQHKLANLLIALDGCRLALLRAGAGGLPSGHCTTYSSAAAVAFAARSLRDAVLEIHHGFGGVSFWEDHEMPRHFRRAHGDLVRYGGVHHARREIANALLGVQRSSHTSVRR